MRKLLKILAALTGLFVLFALAATVFVKIYLPPEKIKALASEQIEKSLHRQVKLGDVSFSVIKGFTIEEFQLSERPDFSAGTFTQISRFHVRLAWLPLLQKRVVVHAVSLEGLRVHVLKHADGTFNFSDLTASPSTAVSTPAGGSPAPQKASNFGFNIARAQVKDGEILFEAPAEGTKLEVSGVTASLKNFALNGPFSADLSLKASGVLQKKSLNAGLAYRGTVDLGGFDPDQISAQFDKFALDYDRWHADLSGAFKGTRESQVDVKLALSSSAGPLLNGSIKGEVSQPDAKHAFSVRAQIEASIPSLKAGQLPLEISQVPADFVFPAVKVGASVSSQGQNVSLLPLLLTLPAGTISISGSADLSKPKIKPQGSAQVHLQIPSLTAAQIPVKIQNWPAGLVLPAFQLDGTLGYKDDAVSVSSLKLKTAQGSLDVSGSAAHLSSPKPEYQGQVSADFSLPAIAAKDIPMRPEALSPQYVFPALSLALKASLKGGDATISSLKANGKDGEFAVSGVIRKAMSANPEPALDVTANLNLPVLHAADLPVDVLPPDAAVPAASWQASLAIGSDAVKIRSLRVKSGRNDFELTQSQVTGLKAKKPELDLLVKCRSFDLGELAGIFPNARSWNLAGGGFFAVAAKGPPSKLTYGGKLKFRGVGASLGGMAFSDFEGLVALDEDAIDIPGVVGKIQGQPLTLDLSVRHYTKRPDIVVDASINRIELDKLIAAIKEASGQKPESAGQGGAPQAQAKAAAPAGPETLIDTEGTFRVDHLIHPNFQGERVEASWNLKGISPTLRHLDGTARFHVLGGQLKSLGDMAASSKIVKILVFPFLIIQKIGSIGGIRLFPNFNDISFSEIAGDYSFKQGVMTMKDTHINSSAGDVSSSGTIDIPEEKLDMKVAVGIASVQPLGVNVSGTFDHLKTSVGVGEFLKNIFKP